MTSVLADRAAPAVRAERGWLRRFHPAPAEPRAHLILLPHAGGSATFFYGLSELLSACYDVQAVQYPGRQDRHAEPRLTEIAEFVGPIVEEIRQSVPDGKIVLFGHSMGSVIGFEVARGLEATGRGPVALFVSGRRGPGRQRPDDTLHLLPDDELLAELMSIGGTDALLLADRELAELVLPTVRADFTAVETYRCQPSDARIDCPVIALIGRHDEHVTVEEALDWTLHTHGGFALNYFDGDHFYLTEQLDKIVSCIRSRI